MRQAVRRLLFLVLTLVVLHENEAQAHGLGVHFLNSLGGSEHRQAGFSWDTSVASKDLFNYRMDLGYEWLDFDKEELKDIDQGVTLENTFGFRLYGDEEMRLWAGPEIVTGIYRAHSGTDSVFAWGSICI